MLAMLILMRVLTEDGRPLSLLRQDVERYQSSGEINLEVTDIQAALARVEDEFDTVGIDRLDGLTIDRGNSWFNLRPSNTEPLLRLNVEGVDAATVDETVERVREVVEGAA
jgi:phosphomannomutase